MKELLEYIAKALVENPDEVEVIDMSLKENQEWLKLSLEQRVSPHLDITPILCTN